VIATTTAKPIPNRRLAWPNCAVCGKPTSRDDTWLSIDLLDVHRRKQERQAWEAARPVGTLISADELITYPDDVPWHWSHTDCVGPAESYWMD
jgi:hypothetical protein